MPHRMNSMMIPERLLWSVRSPLPKGEGIGGFTLVELLVVVTIIVVLLSLLAPALDTAIYAAELAVCQSRQHATTAGVLTYAAGFTRQYPYRYYLDLKKVSHARPIDVQYSNWEGAPPNNIDDRPVFRTFVSINGTFNCPLAARQLDFDGSHTQTNVIADYGFWFDFRFTGEPGMLKLGARFPFVGDAFDVLTGDWSGFFEDNAGNEVSCHNDRDGTMEAKSWQD